MKKWSLNLRFMAALVSYELRIEEIGKISADWVLLRMITLKPPHEDYRMEDFVDGHWYRFQVSHLFIKDS